MYLSLHFFFIKLNLIVMILYLNEHDFHVILKFEAKDLDCLKPIQVLILVINIQVQKF